MESMTYIVVWIHTINGDKNVCVHPITSEKLGYFKKKLMNSIRKQIRMDWKVRKTLETRLVGYIENPVVSLEIINGDFHFVGKVWRS